MLSSYIDQLLKEANAYLASPTIPVLPLEAYNKYLTNGERLPFEHAYFARRKQLIVLSLAYLLEKTEEKRLLLEQVIWEVCNEFSWALPSHLTIVEHSFGEQSDVVIDLFAAETGQTLAEILELVGEEFSPLLKHRIRYEIEKRIFHPFEEKDWAWEDHQNNWSAVIGGCIGMAALSVLPKNSDKQLKIIQKVDRSLQSYLRSFGEDGACEEGVGYWVYGFGYYLYFAQKLADVLGDSSYLDLPKVKKIAAFPYYVVITDIQAIPFSDYHPAELPSGLLSFCKEYFEVSIPQIKEANDLNFDHCYRFAPLYRNLVWTKASPKNQKEIFHYFADVEWGVAQSESHQVIFAAKGGRNDESHNHIDLGHFIFGNFAELFLTDLGAGEYTKDYFDDAKRYSYLVNNALGHSIPIINGQFQQAGAVKAEDTSFVNEVEKQVFRTELKATYPINAELVQFKRKMDLRVSQQSLFLQDNFEFSGSINQVVENFVTTLPVEVQGKNVTIKGKNSCEINFLDATKVQIKTETYKDHQGIPCQANLIQASYDLPKLSTVCIEFQLKAD